MCIPYVRPSTEKAERYVFMLKVFFVLQLIISSLNFAIDTYFVKIGVFGIFLGFCLFLSQRMLVSHLLLVNIMIGIYFSCQFLFVFLDYFQNKINILQASSYSKLTFSVIVLSLVFYVTSSIFYYYPYVQFKMIQYKDNPGLAHIFQRQSRSQATNVQRQVPYDVNYGPITITVVKKNNDNGIFEISRGQGIRI